MDEVEITAQAKQAAMLAVMAAGDASNERAWKRRVQRSLGRFAALVRDDYGYWGREAQGIIDAQVFKVTYQGHHLEESSKRLIVDMTSESSGEVEQIRTERTDTPPGWIMQERLNEEMTVGQEMIVWKKVEAISASKKVRVLVHFEPVRSRPGGEERAANRPSDRPEGAAPSPPSPSGDTLPAPEGQPSAESVAVLSALDGLSAARKLAVKAKCKAAGIESWTDPGPEDVDRVLMIIKNMRTEELT